MHSATRLMPAAGGWCCVLLPLAAGLLHAADASSQQAQESAPLAGSCACLPPCRRPPRFIDNWLLTTSAQQLRFA